MASAPLISGIGRTFAWMPVNELPAQAAYFRVTRTLAMVNKITVVGAGNVGATTAQRVAEKELATHGRDGRRRRGHSAGQGLDQWQSAPIEGFDSRVIGTNGYDETAGSDIVIITAGIARKPGMSRDDLLNTNAGIVKQVSEQVKRDVAERDHHRGVEPARRDVLRREAGHRLSARARDRHGRRARHRALPLVPRRGARRLRARTSRRWCSAATATRWFR